MQIIISPSRSNLSKAIQNKLKELSGLKPNLMKNLPQTKVRMLKDTKNLSWQFPFFRSIKKLTPRDFQAIESFSQDSAFISHFHNFKKSKERYKYIYLRDGSIAFINFQEKKNKIVYFTSDKIKGSKIWLQRTARRLENIYKLILYSVVYDRGLLLHAAGIAEKDAGYLFLGDGGSGKTTICRLSKKYCILHDDIVKAWYNAKSKRFEIYTPDNPFKKVPLKNLFFLKQSKRNKLLKLSSSQAIKEGLKSTFTFKKNYTLCDFSDSTIDLSLDLFRKIDAYRLYFKKDTAFWKLIEGLKTKRISTGGDNERKSKSKNKHNF